MILFFVLGSCATGQDHRGARTLPQAPPRVDAGAPPHECPCKRVVGAASAKTGTASAEATPDPHASALVPVTSQDPSWGDVDAPVTIVMWSDFQCPFCARVAATLDELKRDYGAARIRLVWKHYPLPFHAEARPAAEAAAAVFAGGGNASFWKFHDLAFADPKQLSADNYRAWAGQAGVDPGRFDREVKAPASAEKVRADMALGERLGVRGTPVFRINGFPVQGALPTAAFKEVIDDQLAAAQALRQAGVAAHQIYPTLCEKNVALAKQAEAESEADTKANDASGDDGKIWNVPVGKGDPSLGPADALVTLVVWSDFQCPYCKRLAPTLAGLAVKYGKNLRIVWKDYPMPSHDRALPAATLARLAFDKKGAGGFWRAHDALFAAQDKLDDANLAAIAEKLGLSRDEFQKAVAKHRYQTVFADSAKLAESIDLRGTPTSFVNGVRVVGALPGESFVKVIDDQLALARELVDAGLPRRDLYAAILEHGSQPEELERKEVTPPTDDNPSKGRPDAKVTLQIFGDFQCPYCQQVNPVLAKLERKFPADLRIVWRNYPLSFHEHAALAAEAAQEVFAQKGAASFWRYHDLLFAAQSEAGLGRPQLETLAAGLGVELKQFRAALDSHKHKPALDRDIQAAESADIPGIPAILVNGYYIAGLRPLATFEHVVERALTEARAGTARPVREGKRVPK
jgi:protein-disulfide isomerase